MNESKQFRPSTLATMPGVFELFIDTRAEELAEEGFGYYEAREQAHAEATRMVASVMG